MDTITQAISSVVIALIGWLAIWAKAMINEKIKSDKYKRIANAVADAATGAAKHVAQVYVDDLREASKDGKLTPEEKESARKQALSVLLQDLGKSTEAELYDWMQFSTEKDRDAFLFSKIEAAVSTLKQISPAQKEVSVSATIEGEVANGQQ